MFLMGKKAEKIWFSVALVPPLSFFWYVKLRTYLQENHQRFEVLSLFLRLKAIPGLFDSLSYVLFLFYSSIGLICCGKKPVSAFLK